MSSAALAYAFESAPQTSFVDRVLHLLDQIDCRLMESDEEREAVARMRYDAYVREGAISPNPTRRFADPYDEKGKPWIFGLYIGDEMASSIRIHVASKANPVFPSFSVFRDLLEPQLDAGKIIIDPTRFVTDPNMSRLYPGLPHVTVRLCWMAAEHFAAEYFLAAVRPEHQAFYRRIFTHRPICGPRHYPMLNKPITLMTVDYKVAADKVHHRYPFFRSTFFERRMLFEQNLVTADIPLRTAPILRGATPISVAAQAG
jgi:N-acyl amino acid synthase FeeM